jgi:TPR repeat protein
MTGVGGERSLDRVTAFLDLLRTSGFRVGVREYQAATELSLMLAAGGKLDDKRLGSLIAPIVCASADEQRDFHRKWRQFQTRPGPPAQSPISRPGPAARGTRHQLRWLWGAMAVAVLAGAGIWFASRSHVEPPVAKVRRTSVPEPAADPRATAGGAVGTGELPTPPSADSEGDGKSSGGKRPNSGTIERPGPAPDPDRSDRRQGGASPPTRFIVPAPDPTPVRHIVKEAFRRQAFRMEGLARRTYDRVGGRRVVALLVCLGALLIWIVSRAARARVLRRERPSESDPFEKLALESSRRILIGDDELRAVMQVLCRREPTSDLELDVPATANATARNAGLFTPVLGPRWRRPTYLALVDRWSSEDHIARLADDIIRKMRSDGVDVESLSFVGDPRFNVGDEQCGYSNLAALGARSGDRRVMIFSDGTAMVDPATLHPRPGLDLFQRWPLRVLFSPIDEREYPQVVSALRSAGFQVLAAGRAGLRALADLLLRPDHGSENGHGAGRPRFPDLLEEGDPRWLDAQRPSGPAIEELFGQLDCFLDRSATMWLRACAVFPALYWEVTLFLGKTLTGDDRQPLFDEQRLLALSRLPWFRYGRIPDWLRLELIRRTNGAELRRTRRAIRELLETVGITGTPSFALPIVRQRASILRELWQTLSLRSVSRKFSEDALFLSAMSPSPLRRLAFAAPPKLRGLLVHRDLRPLALTAAAIGLALATTAAWPSTSNMVERGIDAWYGRHVARDDQKAADLFERSCEAGNMLGCAWAGEPYFYSRGRPRDAQRTVDYDRRACDGGNQLGCTWLGVMLQLGDGIGRDVERGRQLFKMACDKGEPEGCANLADYYLSGRLSTVEKGALRYAIEVPQQKQRQQRLADLREAHRLAEKACSTGSAYGCQTLGALYWGAGQIAFEPSLTPSDPARAGEALQRACDSKERACAWLGSWHLAQGRPEQALAVLRHGCEGGSVTSCRELGEVLESRGELAQAFRLQSKVCEDVDTCDEYGRMLARGIGAPANPAAAVARLRAVKSVDATVQITLGTLSWLALGLKPDPRQIVDGFTRACELGDTDGCFSLAEALDAHLSEQRAPLESARLVSTACIYGNSTACARLASLYRSGTDLPRDPQAAGVLLSNLRALGDKTAMVELALAESDVKVGNAKLRALCEQSTYQACAELGFRAKTGVGFEHADAAAGHQLVEKACAHRIHWACHSAGHGLAHGAGTAPDPGAAADRFARACAQGVSEACVDYADLFLEERVTENVGGLPPVAVLENACDVGQSIACERLGRIHARGLLGRPVDSSKARAAYQKPCVTFKKAPDCATLARQYRDGSDLPKQLDLAEKYFVQGCELGDSRACDEGGALQWQRGARSQALELYRTGCERGAVDDSGARCSLLAARFQKGDHAPRDVVRARHLYEQACGMGNRVGCNNLGVMWASGEGGAIDVVRARALYRRSCELKDPVACYNLSKNLVEQAPSGSTREAIQVAISSCDMAEAMGCKLAGDLAVGPTGASWEAVRLYHKGCLLKDGASCEAEAMVRMKLNDQRMTPEVVRSLQQGCKHGHPAACGDLGYFHFAPSQYGAEDRPDYLLARQLLEKACQGGAFGYCAFLGKERRLGSSFDRDFAAADKALRLGCAGKAPESCAELGALLTDRSNSATNPEAGEMLLRDACTAKNDTGCLYLGLLLREDAGNSDRFAEGTRALLALCSRHVTAACQELERATPGRDASLRLPY